MSKLIKIEKEEIEALEEVLKFSIKSQSVVTLFCCSNKSNPIFDLKQVVQLGKYQSIVDDFLDKIKKEQ